MAAVLDTKNMEDGIPQEAVWCVVELFGRVSYGGRVRQVDFLGDKFLELVIPSYVNRYGEKYEETTRMLSKGAIYSILKCTEEYAIAHQNGYSASSPHRIATVSSEPPKLTMDVFDDQTHPPF